MRRTTVSLFVVCLALVSNPARGENAADAGALIATGNPAAEPARGSLLQPLAHQAVEQLSQPVVDWSQRYDAARRKRNRGRMWMWIGAGVLGTGIAMATTKTGVTEECVPLGRNTFECTIDYRLPYLVTVGGGSAFVLGIMQQRSASRTMRDLEAQRSKQSATPPAVIPLTGRTAVALGPRTLAVVQHLDF